MSIYELILVGIGLSMDAFAVALCKGLNMRRLNYRHGAIIALFFGGFQALMPLIGWALGNTFEHFIVQYDHWVAFILLGIIGIQMLKEAKEDEGCGDSCSIGLDLKELLMMAVATSIDALAVGITFAFLQVDILPAVSLIGCTTFIISFAGVVLGNRFGARFKSKAHIAGGVVLILIGVKILVEHLGLIG